jgi:diadenosine tetraphosphate (Ap4A) HIT family hydrolase
MAHSSIYDDQNIFAKIIAKKIPCQIIHEDDYSLSFHDINPKAAIHALVIPKGPFVNPLHFYEMASSDAVLGFYRGLSITIRVLNLDQTGYRLITNGGPDSHQEVPHFHVHILGGQSLHAGING